jgi:hypothetical protein
VDEGQSCVREVAELLGPAQQVVLLGVKVGQRDVSDEPLDGFDVEVGLFAEVGADESGDSALLGLVRWAKVVVDGDVAEACVGSVR